MLLIENGQFNRRHFSLAIDLHVKPDCFCAVLGGSGSGKSTLLSIIAGFETLGSGTLHLDGADMQGVAPSARPVSMIFQDHNVFAHLNVHDNVALGISPSLRLTEEEDATVCEALARVGLSHHMLRMPGAISGGERQRVAVARVLVRKRKILLLDEPFAALDPGLRHEMLDLIKDLRRENGLMVILVTHQPDEAQRAADHIIFLANGLVREPVSVETFFQMQGDKAIETYLGKWR
ncbi:MAG: ATP-binding cassette domain-containing protein [Alphaproteobacteria bacterium]|nr:ATP-binding cassette domain-containing protein [Alphaproteobacteria bacterium]